MLKNMSKDPLIIENLCEHLNEDRKNQLYCDLMLESQDGQLFSVHKNVLAACPYFQLKIEGLDKSSSFEKINLDINAKQLDIVINYLYTGKVLVTDFTEIKNLYGTAQKIYLDFLKDYSTRKLIASISLHFAFEYWQHAVKYSIGDLKTQCINFIAKNTVEFFDNYLSCFENDNDFLEMIENRKEFRIDEIEFYRIIRKWIGKNDNLRNRYVDSILLEKVDYTKINISFIQNEILSDKMLLKHPSLITKMLQMIKV